MNRRVTDISLLEARAPAIPKLFYPIPRITPQSWTVPIDHSFCRETRPPRTYAKAGTRYDPSCTQNYCPEGFVHSGAEEDNCGFCGGWDRSSRGESTEPGRRRLNTNEFEGVKDGAEETVRRLSLRHTARAAQKTSEPFTRQPPPPPLPPPPPAQLLVLPLATPVLPPQKSPSALIEKQVMKLPIAPTKSSAPSPSALQKPHPSFPFSPQKIQPPVPPSLKAPSVGRLTPPKTALPSTPNLESAKPIPSNKNNKSTTMTLRRGTHEYTKPSNARHVDPPTQLPKNSSLVENHEKTTAPSSEFSHVEYPQAFILHPSDHAEKPFQPPPYPTALPQPVHLYRSSPKLPLTPIPRTPLSRHPVSNETSPRTTGRPIPKRRVSASNYKHSIQSSTIEEENDYVMDLVDPTNKVETHQSNGKDLVFVRQSYDLKSAGANYWTVVKRANGQRVTTLPIAHSSPNKAPLGHHDSNKVPQAIGTPADFENTTLALDVMNLNSLHSSLGSKPHIMLTTSASNRSSQFVGLHYDRAAPTASRNNLNDSQNSIDTLQQRLDTLLDEMHGDYDVF